VKWGIFALKIPYFVKEIRHIVTAFEKIDFSKHQAALATVARVEGSSYRRTGARMLVLDDGTFLGGISGGCLEGDALRRAQKTIATRQPAVVTYDTTRDDANQIGVGLGCNGIIDVLFTPLDPTDVHNPVALLRDRAYCREPHLLATITGCDAHPAVLGRSIPLETPAQWHRDFPLPDLAAAVLRDATLGLARGITQTVLYPATDGPVRVCLEVLRPALQVVLYGGGNDIYPLTRLGQELGWDMTVMANPLKIHKSIVAKVLHPKGDEQPVFDVYTAAVLMAHDYQTDFRHLQQLLASPIRYIGLLGPRKRAQKMFDALAADGKPVSVDNFARIYAPAGLDIGALTPEEIALSIAAEINACFANRPGGALRLRPGAIHDGAFRS
jgi:xanthine dehydrogenase accessory factor